MADRRKLQGEIERCLKKVGEGVETFEDIWKKVYNAANTNQKEKYETDLKKEIKKLQRLRDQLKSWMSASDIKDKKNILDARKKIELQMERFKVVERETKTKAYSKEGLGAAQKLDPAQKEKDEANCWLTACINRLNIQLDKFESEIESVNFILKKKKNDKEKAEHLEELKLRHGKHKYHINQLEALLRMLDNGTVQVEQIKKIKDDLEYYIDYAEDPDFQENEFLYDDLNLEDLEDYLAKQNSYQQQCQLDVKLTSGDEESSLVASTPTSSSSSSPSHSPSLGNNNHFSENSTSSPKVANVPETTHPSQSTLEEDTSHHLENSVSSEVSSHQEGGMWSSLISNNKEQPVNSVNTHPHPFPQQNTETSTACVVGSTINHCVWTDSKYNSSSTDLPQGDREGDPEYLSSSKPESQLLFPVSESGKNVSQDQAQVLQSNGPLNSSVSDFTLRNLSEKSMMDTSSISSHLHSFFPSPSTHDLSTAHSVSRNNASDLFSEASSCNNNSSESPEVQINLSTVFGEIPPHSSPSEDEYIAILERAKEFLPLPIDSQKQRYLSIGSCPMSVPDYYNIYISNCNTKEFFQRLSTETLFFIFYFLQGTKAQYFAARALKIKSWRFHTMFMMWFQRHEEPQKITDEYEQGTYIYFDYERWAQRKKEGFTFEYRYLEDKDFN